MELISLSKQNDYEYEVSWENGVHIGNFVVGDDGYYNFWPEDRGGYWDELMLRTLADKLKELNKEWDDQIQRDLAV